MDVVHLTQKQLAAHWNLTVFHLGRGTRPLFFAWAGGDATMKIDH